MLAAPTTNETKQKRERGESNDGVEPSPQSFLWLPRRRLTPNKVRKEKQKQPHEQQKTVPVVCLCS